MKSSSKYYTLVASLPHLPRIGQMVERNPMNRAQMLKRFKMLSDEDRLTVETAWKFIAWEEQDPKQSDEEIVAEYQKMAEDGVHPALLEVMQYRMNLRTVIAGLRRRLAGEQNAPSHLEWGVFPWNIHIQGHWNEPDFGLGGVFPWISRMRTDLEEGRSLQAQERVMDLVWDSLDRLCMHKSFSLEHVLAFVFKWDILERWLSYNQAQAEVTIESLTDSLVTSFRTQQADKLTA
ncbi:DUF2764 family protein [Rubritalea spongiae]|uniref:DUF2764 family protein n=1 Tax=Rubritalea spongiae TaxID=430797 RepID=A0ABW5E3J4_9BACT